jgi:hypothetical protein
MLSFVPFIYQFQRAPDLNPGLESWWPSDSLEMAHNPWIGLPCLGEVEIEPTTGSCRCLRTKCARRN